MPNPSASERKVAALEMKVKQLQHLLGLQMTTGEDIEVSSIVNNDGEALVDLRWDKQAAQMSPADARSWALDIIQVAGWAEQDAVLFAAARAEFDDTAAAGLMAMMRKARGGDPNRSAIKTSVTEESTDESA